MATRGHIAIKENGKYKYIYNHWDSDIEQLGVTLFKFYKDADKVRALINLGNVSSVGETIENNASCYKDHMDLNNNHPGTVAMYREGRMWKDYDYYNPDKQWEDCKPVETEDLDEVLGEEFTYIFDVDKFTAFEGKTVRAITVPNCSSQPRKFFDKMQDLYT